MKLISDLFYFPPVPMVDAWRNVESIHFDIQDKYQKQTLRNRLWIKTSQGTQKLIVPVHASHTSKYHDVKIDYHEKWQQVHVRSLKTAYGNAPFFEYYFESIADIILARYDSLFEMNLAIAKWLTKNQKQITTDHSLEILLQNNDIQDVRNKFNVDPIINRKNKNYIQVFGNEFISNLSVIDRIFCEGL